jgi:TRAP-type C4-dicarboxylate transport system permease large subunit
LEGHQGINGPQKSIEKKSLLIKERPMGRLRLSGGPLQRGLMFAQGALVGYITPPFGMNLFYMKALVPPDISTKDIWRSTFQFVLLSLALCVYFPKIATWLPNKMIQ